MSDAPSNVVREGRPSRTALRVASLRAVHALLDEPLVLDDPLALRLLGPAREAALRADPFALNDPIARGLRAALVARSRFVEDELARRIAAGVRQVVLLGAGLDTFAYRRRDLDPGLQVFEVDHPGTQQWKRQLLAEAGIGVPPGLRFVPVDLERGDLGEALAAAGFRADRPACVGWMGVTPYLTADAVMGTLRSLAGWATGGCVYFDHRIPPSLMGPVERAVDEAIGQAAAAAGEPWLSSFDPADLQRQLLGLGFAAAVSVASDELNARYFARRKDGLRTGGALRIVCADTGGVRPA